MRDTQALSLPGGLNTSRRLAIRLGTSNGWFELRPGEKDFGPLPADDRLLLAGQPALPADLLADLTAGVIDVGWSGLMQEFNAAPIQYTPPHFKIIHCKITEGLAQGQRALFYDTQRPEFPEEGSDHPNGPLHRAATHLVQHVTAEQGTFRRLDQTQPATRRNLASFPRIPPQKPTPLTQTAALARAPRLAFRELHELNREASPPRPPGRCLSCSSQAFAHFEQSLMTDLTARLVVSACLGQSLNCGDCSGSSGKNTFDLH